jgi:transcriptional regulator with XRE-family HTH domain
MPRALNMTYVLYSLSVMEAPALIRRARAEAGLTQQQLARRLGVTQAALARLERAGANPTVATLDRVLRATGRRLDMRLGRADSSIDSTLLREALRMEPAARIAAAERLLADAEAIAAAGAR